MKTIIELREEAIEKDINPECYLYQKLEKQKEALDKIKEYIKEKVGTEIRDMMYIIDVSEILELLEEIK